MSVLVALVAEHSVVAVVVPASMATRTLTRCAMASVSAQLTMKPKVRVGLMRACQLYERLTAMHLPGAAASASSSDHDSGAQYIRRAFSSLVQMHWRDITTDIRQVAVLEGHSFTRLVLANQLLDWAHGGAVLHVVYLAELLLHRLRLANWDVVVVFFDSLSLPLDDSPQRLAARVLRHHLSSTLSARGLVELHTFSSWWSDEWHHFVGTRHPALVALHIPPDTLRPPSAVTAIAAASAAIDDSDHHSAALDGSSSSSSSSSSSVVPERAATPAAALVEWEVDDSLRLFALHLLISDDIRCISTDWRFNGHLLSSFDLTPRNAAFRPAVAGALVANQARVLELQQASSWPLLPAISTSLASATAREPQWLSHVVAHAKALIAEQTSTPLDRALVDTLFRCFLVHVALARSLALRQRAMSAKAIALGHELGSKVGEFVSTLLAPALETALVSTASNTPAAAAVADCLHSIDLFDGRLFWAVVGSLARRAASGSALVSLEQAFDGSISASWSEWLRDISGNDSAPIDCSPLVALYRASPTECSGKAAANDDDHEDQGLVPLDSPFLRELSQDIDSVLETKLAKCTTAFDDGDDDGMLAFKYHRMTDLPSATEDSKPAAGVSSERYQQIQTQRLYTFLQKFAETLKGNGAVDPHTVSARSDAVIVNRSDVDPDAPSPTQSSPSSAAADSSSSSSTATASTASSTAATRGGKKAAGGAKAKAKAGAKEPKAGAKGGGGGGGGGSKAQQASNRKNLIAQQNLERIAKEDMRRVEQSIEAISSIVDVDDRVRRLASNLRSLTSAGKTAPTALVFGYMRLCEWLMDQWMVRRRQEAIEATSASSSRKSNKKSEATIREERARTMESAVNAVRLVFDVVQLYAEHLSHEQAMTLAEHLSTFGFQAAAESLYAWWAQRTEHKHTEAVTIRGVRDARYVIDMPFARFQLLHCGHLMQRSLDSRTDERVSSFQPDAWQRELLDVVDRRQSALVVAPTSSGKTLVSFYAMKKTLDENKQQSKGKRNVRGVVVYVSPTKALVNQVAAEVYQRYGPVVGTYTREYSHNVASCQVLVTVPECLEQMLLDAAWCARLQFCVLDEIHCIQGTSIDDVTTGKPWERVVDLLPCPFVALSATIGNPKALHSWLQERQRRHGREVQLIIHTYRWCDLRLHVYAPPVNDARDKQQRTTFTTTSDTPATPGLKRLHPIACLSAVELREPGRLNTMSLAADECLELYDAMVHVSGSTTTTSSTTKTTTTTTTTLGDATDLEAIRALSPERYFGERHCILRVNVFTWEAALKAELARWTTEAPARLEALLLRLAGKAHAPEAVYPANAGFSSEYLVPLLIELNANGMLPAIVFTLSRQKCTQHALALLKALVDRENQERATPEYQKRLAQTLKVAQQLDKKSKRARDKDDSKLKSGQHEKGTGAALGEDADLAPQKSLLLDQRLINDEPDPQYSFTRVNEQSWLDRGYWIDRIRRRVTEPWLTTLIDGLERGVGVHHAGLPRPYRLAVEVLFRSGHLKVVFATSTLALGINMPCRTTVFLDDSPYLTPLLFRQMSGRAGRRGYDDLGHIVTWYVDQARFIDSSIHRSIFQH